MEAGSPRMMHSVPMNRRSFPTGQTTMALLKALLRTLSAEKGTAVADTWLRGIRMIRDDLEDLAEACGERELSRIGV